MVSFLFVSYFCSVYIYPVLFYKHLSAPAVPAGIYSVSSQGCAQEHVYAPKSPLSDRRQRGRELITEHDTREASSAAYCHSGPLPPKCWCVRGHGTLLSICLQSAVGLLQYGVLPLGFCCILDCICSSGGWGSLRDLRPWRWNREWVT